MKASSRFTFLETALENAGLESFLCDVRTGLTAPRKHLPCRWFYDSAGSRLFEEICTLEEYYLPRAETEILLERADEIAARLPLDTGLIELGCGDSRKTRILIEALLRRQKHLRYAMIDVSRAALEHGARALLSEYPAISVTAVHGEYRQGLARIDAQRLQPKLVLWLGSSVGNFDHAGAAAFLGEIAASLGEHDRFLMGADLRKDKAALDAAYDDARGVTARFNLNLLARINRELGGHFDLDQFAHRASYDPERGRIEMHLISRRQQRVRIDAAGIEVGFQAGEAIHTEDSYKYTRAEIEALARDSGLCLEQLWLDSGERFALAWFARSKA